MTELEAFGGGRLLLDASAWARADAPGVAEEWAQAVESGQIVVCAPFMVEALYTARNETEYAELEQELRLGFDHVALDTETWTLTLTTQRQLAAQAPSFHRKPPVDLLIASTAHQHGLAVLHYDSDYDTIAEHTTLEFESRWIAPRGSL